jgi:hypothetical protein
VPDDAIVVATTGAAATTMGSLTAAFLGVVCVVDCKVRVLVRDCSQVSNNYLHSNQYIIHIPS